MNFIQINPPFYLYAAVLIMIILHLWIPLIQFISYPFTLIGLIPLVYGVVLNLLADASLKKEDTTVKPLLETRVLITTGIYKLTRNPMYLGFGMILLGAAILLGSLLPFIIVFLYPAFMDMIFIRFEEQKLEEKFQGIWTEYKNNVRRWI
jgi:protein-S-isoprenylcysteine O-methyltransferase Ste14